MSSRPGYSFDAAESPLFRRRTAAEAGVVSTEVAAAALQRDAVARRILAKGHTVQPGDRIGTRLNINVKKSTGVAVNTVHRGKKSEGYKMNRGWYDGEVLDYQPVVTLRNAYLNVHQASRERIATGVAAKMPMASVDGEYVLPERPCFDGIEVHFSPHREHLFRDANGCAVRRADEVTVVGNACFLRGVVEYYSEEDAPPRAGDAPSEAVLLVPREEEPTRPARVEWQPTELFA